MGRSLRENRLNCLEKKHDRGLEAASKANRHGQGRIHAGFKRGTRTEDRVRRDVVHDDDIPGCGEEPLRYITFEFGWCIRASRHPDANLFARLADFQHSHEVVRQDSLHELGDAVEHLADVENSCQSAEKTIEHFKIRRDITPMPRRIGKRFLKPHGVALYSSGACIGLGPTLQETVEQSVPLIARRPFE